MNSLKQKAPATEQAPDVKRPKGSRLQSALPLIMIWTNSYERLAWTPLLVIIALQLDSPAALAYSASAYSAANLIGNLLFGSLSDRYGRFKIAGIALISMMVTTLLHMQLWSAAALIVIRLLHGFFAAAVTPTALAAASEGIQPAERGKIMARVGLMIAFASIAAPPIADRLTDMVNANVTQPEQMTLGPILLIQAAILLIVGVLGITFQRKYGKDQEVQTDLQAAPHIASSVSDTQENSLHDEEDESALGRVGIKATVFVCVIGFAIMFSQNILFYALPLQGVTANLSPSTVGGLFGVFAVGSAVAFMPPFSKASDRFGRVKPIIVGCLTASLGLYFLGRGIEAVSLVMMTISLLFYGFGFGLAFPALSASTADSTDESRRGLAFGLLTAAFSVGAIAGPLIAQSLAPYVSPFTVASIVMVVGLSSVAIARKAPELHRVIPET